MQQEFTKQFMIDNRGCYSQEQLDRCSFMANEPITLKSIISSEIRLKDKYWFVCKKLATKEQNQQIAIRVAEIVLPIYERRYPENKAPREAIEAAKQYIAGHITLVQLLEKRRAAADAAAAAAADAAAYAYDADAAAAYAYAAAAAADAAAADAADAAAYAYDADSYAAYAADADAAYAYDAAAIKKELEDYLLTFVE